MENKRGLAIFILTIMLTVSPLFANNAYAIGTNSGTYNANNAKAYANTWSMVYNTNQYHTVSNDCTNFISQCLRAGGWPLANTALLRSNVYAWYNGSSSNSHTWDAAHNLWQFICTNSNPSRGSNTGVVYNGNTSTAYPSYVSYGDVFFYDWENDGNMNHSSMYVENGTDVGVSGRYTGSGYTGALVDCHNNDRYKAIWSLSYYNSMRTTTRIYPVHLNASF